MTTFRSRRPLDYLFLGLLLYATNIRGFGLSRLIAPLQVELAEVVIEVALVLVALWMLQTQRLWRAYARLWTGSLPLLAFIGIAALSMIWTIDRTATLLRVSVLVLCSLLAAYLAVRYTLRGLLETVAIYFVVLIVSSAVLALAWPILGTMQFYPYNGSWSGVFWHRNYLGSTMAFGSLILLLASSLTFAEHRNRAFLYAAAYASAVALVVLSRSATGVLLAMILHAEVAAIALWLRWRSRLRSLHYWITASGVAVLGAIGYTRLNLVLGFFNRDSTFTGRAGLWSYLVTYVIAQRPLLGHGFGVLWVLPGFQLALRNALGWPYPIVIGDNGYIDIALHLGVIGLAVFVGTLGWAAVRCGSFFLDNKSLLAAVPALVLAYVLVTNVSLSYYLETESFTWLLLLAFVFSARTGSPQ